MALPLGPVRSHVRAAAEEISRLTGITNIGGFASTGHITNSDHYKGLAIDVMVTNKQQGDLVQSYAQNNAGRLAVKYTIWNRRYWDLNGNEPYTGANPHTSHVHISFHATAGSGGPVQSAVPMQSKQSSPFPIEGIAAGIGGSLLVIVGLVALLILVLWKGLRS